MHCDIDTLNVSRTGSLWIGSNPASILAIHKKYPHNHCTKDALSFSLNQEAEQCVNGHSGVLCGGCQLDKSIVLGSTKCMQCGDTVACLWLPVLISLMGLAMVTMLFVLNCTVSTGLTLYANIIRPGIIDLLPRC